MVFGLANYLGRQCISCITFCLTNVRVKYHYLLRFVFDKRQSATTVFVYCSSENITAPNQSTHFKDTDYLVSVKTLNNCTNYAR